ncbi:ribose transport system permease protein [Paenarthrobacter nitroguajacolicus]|uniref:ABC transporter permease n=1 Tax=Paenarthrobacter TaxID=1742992 RepID=UPI002859EA42|nr:ABC transporter permease [Paenarthrobacter nitroguajacolicus]MDR6987466.1 ribose transport system permease protein [Paenarthrobacter nitroguajacolicus]
MQPKTATGLSGQVSGKAGPGESQVESRSRLSGVGDFIGAQGLLVVVLLFGVLLTFLSPVFLTTVNLVNLLYQCTILGVFAIGMTFVILTGGIDVSVGSTAALSSVLSMGVIVNMNMPPAIGLLTGLVVGAGVGAINGLMVTKLGISPLIATLATLSAGSGIAFAYSDGGNITPVPKVLTDVVSAKIAGIPLLIPAVLVLAFLAYLALTRTTYGRSIYAVGGNKEAALLAGIRVDRVTMNAYIIAGLSAGMAGLLLTGRLASGSPRAGDGIELTVIAAVVIGGTSLFGGQGNIKGTLLGVLLIAMVSNAVNLLGIPSSYDRIVQGVVIFAAAALDVYRYKYVQKNLSRKRKIGPPPSKDAEGAVAPHTSGAPA